MNTIVPEGELLRRATEYVLKRIAEGSESKPDHKTEPGHDQEYGYMKRVDSAKPDKGQVHLSPQQIMTIIDDACMNFNLGPKDAETMLRIFQNGSTASSPPAQPSTASQSQDQKK